MFVGNRSSEAPPLVPSRNPNIALDEGCWLCQNNLQDFDYRDVLVLDQFIRFFFSTLCSSFTFCAYFSSFCAFFTFLLSLHFVLILTQTNFLTSFSFILLLKTCDELLMRLLLITVYFRDKEMKTAEELGVCSKMQRKLKSSIRKAIKHG